MYPEPDWHNSCWLAQRWIEILSMQPPLKYQLMAAADASPTLEALAPLFERLKLEYEQKVAHLIRELTIAESYRYA